MTTTATLVTAPGGRQFVTMADMADAARLYQAGEGYAVRAVTGRRRPAECGDCGEVIEYVHDDDGLWAECACDMGYAA